jgi:hypothetical protein
MSNDVSNLNDTIIPKSDQLNADQLIGGPVTITVTSVRRGSGDDQPVVVHYENEGGRPYKPCLTMRKVLIFAWGEDGSQWAGRMLTLYNKRDVKWGGVEVGGIRISHMSHVQSDIKLSLAVTRGKKEPIIIKRLDASDPLVAARAKLDTAARSGMEALKAAWGSLPAPQKIAIGGQDGCPAALKAIAAAVDAPKADAPPAPVQAATVEKIDTSAGEVTNVAREDDNPNM